MDRWDMEAGMADIPVATTVVEDIIGLIIGM
jgi:hypothetical protein